MKNIIKFVLVVLLCTVFAKSVFASSVTDVDGDKKENEAQEITNAVIAVSQNEQNVGVLSDRNRNTRFTVTGETEITISSESEIASIYLIWDYPPSALAVKTNRKDKINRDYKFLHEYVEISPSTDITISWEQGDVTLCDIYLFSEGKVPKWVQKWKPPYEDADMLILPTHADDEHLFFGGIMPYYAGELEYKVQVAYLTNHITEIYRQHELLNGLWTVGITAYPVISDFPDLYSMSLESAQQLYDEQEMTEFQVMLLRRFKPEVVIGHDVNGEYGHGVHMINTLTLQKAIPLSGDSSKYPDTAKEYGVFDVQKVYLHLYDEDEIVMDWNVALDNFDGKTALDMAKLGFAEHYSQQTYFAVEDSGPYDCRKFGLYHTTVGSDMGEPDFFENVEFESQVVSSESVASSSQSISSAPVESNSVQSSKPIETTQDGGNMTTIFIIIACVVVACAVVVYIYIKRNKDNDLSG